MYLMKFIKYGDSLYLTYLSWDEKTEKADMAKDSMADSKVTLRLFYMIQCFIFSLKR